MAAPPSPTHRGQPARLLIGKWEGDIQNPGGRGNQNRTLVIESVGEGEGPVAVRGRYGITGHGMRRMNDALETSGGQATLEFTTGGGSPVVLRLHGEKDLIGTIRFRGTGEGVRDLPMRLKKVE